MTLDLTLTLAPPHVRPRPFIAARPRQALLLEFSRVDHHADIGLWFPNGSLPYFQQDLATFLLVRGPFAWIGYVWSGCTDSGYPAGCDPNCDPTGPADEQVVCGCLMCVCVCVCVIVLEERFGL